MQVQKKGLILAVTEEQNFKDKETGKPVKVFQYYLKDPIDKSLVKIGSSVDMTQYEGQEVDVLIDLERFGKDWSVKLAGVLPKNKQDAQK